MKVGLLIYGSLDTLSGGYLYDRILVEHLRAQGDTVHIVSIPWRTWLHHLTDNLSPALHRQLKALDVDILVQDELAHPSLFLINRWLQRRADTPIVSIVHHLRCSELRPAWQNDLYRAVEQSYLQTLDGFVFNSHTTQRIVESLAPKKPAVVAYPGGDRLDHTLSRDWIKARAARKGPLRLLFFGNVIHRKGLHTLLDALEAIHSEPWILDVVGGLAVEPSYTDAIRRQIQTLGLGGRITLHGAVFDDALRPFLSDCDALVLPSSYEGFGIVYMEAAACGLPSIASSAGGAPEIVTHGVNGFVVDPGDTVSLSRSIARWTADRGLLERMSLAAKDRYDAHPTWDQTAHAFRRFLLSMIQPH